MLRHLRKWAPATLTLAALLVLVSPMPGDDQAVSLGKEAYLMPPKEIADAVLAPQHETRTLTNLSPDGMKFVIIKSDGLPPLKRLARPCVYLAEMAFDPVACRSRELWIRSSVGFDIFYHADKRTVAVQVPERARVSNPVWSPDSSMLAFFAHFDEATHVYVADTETGYSRRLTITPVLATLVTTFQWSGDGRRIQTVLVPDDGKREMPRANGVPAQPKVRVARGGTNPSRTYRFLLESPQDVKLLEHLATGQLALIDVNDGKVTRIGFPNMIRSVSMAPGERDFRVTTMKKPFSYFVPFTRFGSQEGIWNLLMYHGMDDANVGTNPINAQHMFLALDGLGKPAALYMYPYEGHGPIARETTLDLWARWVAWLDTYVKNPKKKETPSPLDKEVKSP